jgi:N-acetylmuramoyl-L-alanine amidase
MPFRLNRALFFLFSVTLTLLNQSLCAGQSSDMKLRTVVIDAGHGGKDPGAISSDNKLREKTITLDVALKLGQRIKDAYPDVKVIYTRSKDTYLTLAQRTNIANRNQADLFISIHVNSVPSSKPRGSETYIMGTDQSHANMEVCKKENSVILLEDDYTTTYQGYDPNEPESFIFFNLMQNAHFEQSVIMASKIQEQLRKGPITVDRGVKQALLLVLWRTTMPSVLVEIGFLSNAADRKQLASEAGRKEIAGRLFTAFSEFKKQYDSHSGMEIETPVTTPDIGSEKEKPASSESASSDWWMIQIFAAKKQVKPGAPDFKGLKNCVEIFQNGYYKYCTGRYATREEAVKALPELRKKFDGAFIVHVDKNNRIL